jgi:REP element-mobilizing transposase RayT
MAKRCRKRHVQAELVFNRRGGKRKGAGRKRVAPRRCVPHVKRPELNARNPLHITLRVFDEVGRLRRREGFRIARQVMLNIAVTRQDFRLVHLSLQGNHIHLVCEADSRTALTRGIQAFKISFARRLNRAIGHRGAVFSDRYHEEVLTSPRQVRHCLNYVLNNWRRHREDRGATYRVDPYSTGIHFPGWSERRDQPPPVIPPDIEVLPSTPPRTWLLAESWKRSAPISLYDVPGPR